MLLVDKWGEREMRDTLVSTTMHYIKVGRVRDRLLERSSAGWGSTPVATAGACG